MSVQKGSYYDIPVRGYDGDLAELGNYEAGLQVAAEDLNVARVIKKGADLEDPDKVGSFDYTVSLVGDAGDELIGVTLRVPGLEGNPQNTQDSVPIYRQGDEVNFLQQGYMWIKLDENSAAVTDTTSQAYFVFTAGTFAKGQIVNTSSAETAQTSKIRFMSIAQPGEMVKIWVNCLLS
jgi:hypothetical protein